MPLQDLANGSPLNTDAAAVDDAQLPQTLVPGRFEILLNHVLDLPRRKAMEIEDFLDGKLDDLRIGKAQILILQGDLPA